MPVIGKLVRSIHVAAKTNQGDVIQRIGCVRAVSKGGFRDSDSEALMLVDGTTDNRTSVGGESLGDGSR